MTYLFSAPMVERETCAKCIKLMPVDAMKKVKMGTAMRYVCKPCRDKASPSRYGKGAKQQ